MNPPSTPVNPARPANTPSSLDEASLQRKIAERTAHFTPTYTIPANVADKTPEELRGQLEKCKTLESRSAELKRKRDAVDYSPTARGSPARKILVKQNTEDTIAYLSSIQEELQMKQEFLNELKDRGVISTHDFLRELKLLESRKAQSALDYSGVLRHKETITAQQTDLEDPKEWAEPFWDLLAAAVKGQNSYPDWKREPFHSHWVKILRVQQHEYIIKEEGPENIDWQNELLWCPVTAQEHLGQDFIAAHLYPAMLGPDNAASMFGQKKEDGLSTLWNPENGIHVNKIVESRLEAGALTFAPVMPLTNPIEYKCIIMTTEKSRLNLLLGSKPLREYAHQQLEFKTKFRPHPKYIFFHYAMTIARNRHTRSGTEGVKFVNDWLGMFTSKNTQSYGRPEEWYSHSVLKQLARYLRDDENLMSVLFPVIGNVTESLNDVVLDDEKAAGLEHGAFVQAGQTSESIADLGDDVFV